MVDNNIGIGVNAADTVFRLWQQARMTSFSSVSTLERKLIDSLYVEAIVLADEARAYFDHLAEGQRDALDPCLRVDFACESLKITTRIMHVIAWLLTQRAVFAGELAEHERLDECYRLGAATATQATIREHFSPEMEGLILVSEDLYDRVARLEQQFLEGARLSEGVKTGPARELLGRLEAGL
jgi:regulator of CtrA degradation